MMKRWAYSFGMVLAALLMALPLKAQLFFRAHARIGELPPKFILVELPTESNRYRYFMQHNKEDKATKVKLANNAKMHCMVSDFSDNYTFCPVYFFNDTDQDKIIAHNFAAALRDKNLDLISALPALLTDTNYVIVYYGLPPSEVSKVSAEGVSYTAEYNDVSFNNLVAVSPSFKKLKQGLPDKAKFNAYQLSNFMNKYGFQSKEFDIEYKPLAGFYDRTLRRYYFPKKHKQ
jgi:hypothetical protein